MIVEFLPLSPPMAEIVNRGEALLAKAFAERSATVPKGTALIDPRASSNHPLMIMRSGWARRSHLLPDGRRTTLGIYVAGDLIGLHTVFGSSVPDGVTALTSTTYQVISASGLEKMLEDPAAVTYLLWMDDCERLRLEALATALSVGTAEERVAALLFNLYQRLRRCGQIDRLFFPLPLTQQDMAEHLGITVLHASRALRVLRERRIAFIDSGILVINDLERLERAASGGA